MTDNNIYAPTLPKNRHGHCAARVYEDDLMYVSLGSFDVGGFNREPVLTIRPAFAGDLDCPTVFLGTEAIMTWKMISSEANVSSRQWQQRQFAVSEYLQHIDPGHLKVIVEAIHRDGSRTGRNDLRRELANLLRIGQ